MLYRPWGRHILITKFNIHLNILIFTIKDYLICSGVTYFWILYGLTKQNVKLTLLNP